MVGVGREQGNVSIDDVPRSTSPEKGANRPSALLVEGRDPHSRDQPSEHALARAVLPDLCDRPSARHERHSPHLEQSEPGPREAIAALDRDERAGVQDRLQRVAGSASPRDLAASASSLSEKGPSSASH